MGGSGRCVHRWWWRGCHWWLVHGFSMLGRRSSVPTISTGVLSHKLVPLRRRGRLLPAMVERLRPRGRSGRHACLRSDARPAVDRVGRGWRKLPPDADPWEGEVGGRHAQALVHTVPQHCKTGLCGVQQIVDGTGQAPLGSQDGSVLPQEIRQSPRLDGLGLATQLGHCSTQDHHLLDQLL
uniref:Secreted protein n=1 Tax=Ixodes ricinus TaxID=34613 RepID=A0A6B0V068_IXORI